MVLSNYTTNLCLFCYKSTTLLSPLGDQNDGKNSFNVQKFCRLLDRFVRHHNGVEKSDILKGLNGCRDCNNLIKSFCKLYHKIKVLELKLLLKLNNLGNVMRMADKVPARVNMVKSYFENLSEEIIQANEYVSQSRQDGLKSLINFRRKIIEKCCRARTLNGLQPCVLLNRIDGDKKNMPNTITDSMSIEYSNVSFNQRNVFYEWFMRFAVLVYVMLSTPSLDNFHANEPLTDLTIIDDRNEDDGENNSDMSIMQRCNDTKDIGQCSLLDGNHDIDFQSNIEDVEETEMSAEIKHSPFFNVITTITTTAPAKSIETNIKIEKVTGKKRNKNSTRHFRFKCNLCQTFYNSYNKLRQHKNNRFHNFLKKKTLKIVLNIGGQTAEINSHHTDDNNKTDPTLGADKQNIRKRYNLRNTKRKSYLASNDDDSKSDTQIAHEEPEEDITFKRSSSISGSSSETTDSDSDDGNISSSRISNKINVKVERQVVNRKTKKKTKLVPVPSEKLIPKVTKFICSICALEVSSGEELANHELNHQKNSKTYVTCPRCKKYIPSVQYKGHFMKNHLGANQKLPKFECEICGIRVAKLPQHFKFYHKVEDTTTKIYKCGEDNCKAYFIKAIQLIYHKRKMHNFNPFECKYCGVNLKRRGRMRDHIGRFHPDKFEDPSLPIACSKENCKRRFGTEVELEWHLKFDNHDDITCKKCGEKFVTGVLLRLHLDKKCGDSKKFICQLCGKGLKAKTNLELHLKYHKGPESYEWQCQTCGKRFMTKWLLKSHSTSHTNEKKWICQWCGEKYAYQRSWKKHVFQKHKDKEGLPEVRKFNVSERVSRKGARPGDCVLAGVKRCQ